MVLAASLGGFVFFFLCWLITRGGSRFNVENHYSQLLSEKFEKVRFSFQITPSSKYYKDMIFLEYDQAEDEDASSIQHINHTAHYFPIFEFTHESIPVGNPIPYCFWFGWSEKEMEGYSDQYNSFKKMPDCSNFKNGGHWLDSDPTRGVDISIWDEHITPERQT